VGCGEVKSTGDCNPYQETLSRKLDEVLKDTKHRSVDRKWIEIKKVID
jgi:hypothetical protein